MSTDEYLKSIHDDIRVIRQLLSKVINHTIDAEREVPERMRRFMSYMHDVHDVVWMFEERGHVAPGYIMRELERCDDRLRQLLDEMHTDGGVFEKVRQEMAKDPKNRWGHTRQLAAPTGGKGTDLDATGT